MAKSNCPLTEMQEDNEMYVANKLDEVQEVYWDVFSANMGLDQDMLEQLQTDIENAENDLADLQDQYAVEKGADKFKEMGEITKQIKSTKARIKVLKKENKESLPKVPLLKEINKIITDYVREVMDSNMYTTSANPKDIMELIKEGMIEKPYSLVFQELSSLDYRDLRSIKTHLVRELPKLNEISKQKDPLMGGWLSTIAAPEIVSKYFDPTGRAYKVIRAAGELAERAFGSRAIYEQTIADIYERLMTMTEGVSGQEYLFMMDRKPGMKVSDDDTAQSMENVYKFFAEAGRGTVRRIMPTPMFKVDKNGRRYHSEEFSEDSKEWERIINSNAKNGIGMNGWIQDWYDAELDETKYYVVIPKIAENGAEYYRAYDAPIYVNDKGKERVKVAPNPSNRAFYQEFQQKEENTIGGYKRWNASKNSFEIVEGRMPSGWYRAGGHKTVAGRVLWGKNKDTEFQTNTDYGFALDEKLNKFEDEYGIHPDIWTGLSEFRNIFKSARDDIIKTNQVYEARLLDSLKKLFPDHNWNQGALGRKDISKMVKEKFGFNIDMLDMNISVRGDTIYTNNTTFDSLVNYWPIFYTEGDKSWLMVESFRDLESKIDWWTAKKDVYEGRFDEEALDKRTYAESKVEDFENSLKFNEAIFDHINLGTEMPTFNQVTQIKAAKHRTSISSPLPIKRRKEIVVVGKDGKKTIVPKIDPVFGGMRLDAGVPSDYLKQMYTSSEQNRVKIELFEAIAEGVSPSMQNYMVNQVKSAFGRRDVTAGFGKLDYSDDRFGISEDGPAVTWTQRQNKLMSSNLITGPGTSFSNNFQRTNTAIVHTAQGTWKAMQEGAADPERMKRAAAYHGITNEISTLADVLVGNSAGGRDWALDGMLDKVHITMLLKSTSKYDFVNKARKSWLWKKIGNKLVDRLDLPGKDAAKHWEWAMEDTWELSAGLIQRGDENILSKPRREALNKRLHGIYLDHLIDRTLKFHFEGTALTRLFIPKKSQARTYFAFSPAETQMRSELLIAAANQLKEEGYIDQKWIDSGKDVWLHPEVGRLARIWNNNTMFSMSKANLPPAFRGLVGEVHGKLKQYTWNQLRFEYNVMRNWMLGNWTGLNYVARADSIRRIIANPSSKTEKQMRNFLLMRVSSAGIAFVTQLPKALMWTPGKSAYNSIVQNTLGWKGSSAFNRGTKSEILEGFLKIAAWGLTVGVDITDEEEEKVYQGIYRYFLPVWWNIFIDSFLEKDPFKVVGLYSKTLHKGTSMLMDAVRD
tara:strand:+ start:27975 stop:31739 length:3765 start_codon:yes stop_codon:yes gene_type:complete